MNYLFIHDCRFKSTCPMYKGKCRAYVLLFFYKKKKSGGTG